ncbi:hypothetical protein ACFWN1_18205 [Streptomyces sp. NPDC058459]|uniref:hypothetical protein n=1 Tax=Streptomyces sp. NPDC058459 TaxID=3346508 RepID=UPI0036630C1A
MPHPTDSGPAHRPPVPGQYVRTGLEARVPKAGEGQERDAVGTWLRAAGSTTVEIRPITERHGVRPAGTPGAVRALKQVNAAEHRGTAGRGPGVNRGVPARRRRGM